ncbi:MAG TPA: WD40 repeat domain-containing protein, partial [Roseiflexaceae bacterium]|nr:WD40 repeat domain-containing protein [Roseiflexaceae bacterium]
ANLRLAGTINAASEEWDKHRGADEDAYLVHQGGRLEEADTLRRQSQLALNELENAYLDACIARRDAQAREREARNMVFVANDLLRRDLTKALRMSQAAYCLDQFHTLARVGRALSSAYYTAIETQSSFYVANLRHKGQVYATRFSRDGQRVLTTSEDGFARLWDNYGNLLAELEHGAPVKDAAFSPDRSRIVTTGKNYLVKLWDGDGNLLANLVGHGPAQFDDVSNVAFAPDGATIVTTGADRRVMIWNSAGELLRKLEDNYDIVRTVVFAPDGRHFATCGVWNDCTARLYTREGELVAELGMDESSSKKQPRWQRGISCVAFSPSGDVIVTTSNDHTAKMWDRAGNHLKILRGHTDHVNWVVFAPDGTRFVTVSNDHSAIVWSVAGEVERRLTGHAEAVKRVACSPIDPLIATGDARGEVRLWDLEGNAIAYLRGHSSAISALEFSPDGAYLVSGSRDRTAKIWKTLPPTQRVFRHDKAIVAAQFIPDGQDVRGAHEVVTASKDMTVRRWSVETGDLLHTYEGFGADRYDNQEIFSLDVSADGRRMVTTGTDYQIRIWDIASGEIARTWDSQVGESCNSGAACGAKTARFSPDGASIISGDFGGQVIVWDAQGQIISQLATQALEVSGVAISRDNKYIATTCHDKVARIWSFETGELLAECKGHRLAVQSVDFSPDGQHIITTSADYTAKLWDLQGRMILDLDRHAHQTTTAAFSSDGQYIITASFDNTAKIWDRTGKLISTIEGHTDEVQSAYFAPDGQTVLTASSDGTARMWLMPESIDAEVRARYGVIYRLNEADLLEYG